MKAAEKTLLTAILAGGILASVLFCTFIMSGDGPESLQDSSPESAGTGALDSESGKIHSDIDEPEEKPIAREIVEPDPEAPRDEAEAGILAMGSGVITGRIIDEYNNPIEGAGITLEKGKRGFDYFIIDINRSGKKEAVDKTQCISGGNGFFTLEKAAEIDNPVLHVYHPDYVPFNHKFNYFDGVSKEVGDIRLEVGGSVSGYVTASWGDPLEGVMIHARPHAKKQRESLFVFYPFGGSQPEWKMETGPDGFFRIKGLPAGEVTLTGSHPDYVAAGLKDVNIQKGRETPRTDLVLTSGMSIAGTVLDEDGKPVEGAKIRADSDFLFNFGSDKELDPTMFIRGNLETETDEKGVFVLKALKEGTYTIRVEFKGFVTERLSDVKAGTLNLACILSRGGMLFGRIVDAGTEKGIEKFDIKVRARRGAGKKVRVLMGKEAVEERPELGDPLGAYFIDGIKTGPFCVKISAEGYGDQSVRDLSAVAGKGVERTLKLWPESTVSGMIYAPSGEPLADARVRIQRPRKKGGQFDTAVFERLGDLGYVGDSVTFPDDWSRQVKSREDGSFLLKGVPDGDFELKASHEDHLDSKPLALTLQKGEQKQDLAITLGAAGSISGTAFGMDGKPEPRARISAVQIGKYGLPSGDIEKVTADDEGTYSIEGLAPGNYKVRHAEVEDSHGMGFVSFYVDSDDPNTAAKGLVPVEEGKVTLYDVYRILKCSVEGLVTEAGHPVEGMTVKLFKSGNRFFFEFMPVKTASTDASGAYSLDELEPGKYRIKLEISGLPMPLDEDVELAEGGMERVNFPLPTGRISGRILDDKTSDPVAGVRVSLNKVRKEGEGSDKSASGQFAIGAIGNDGGSYITLGGGPQPVKTDENGYYLFRFVPDGEYKLAASGEGYVKGDLSPIAVTGGRETAGQNLKLTMGLTLAGKVIEAATGKPIKKYLPITCVKNENGEESEAMTGSSSGDRGFRFPGLLPGTYRILAMEGNDYLASLEVTLKDQDITDLELVVK